MIYALIEYRNQNGKILMKATTSEEETNAFVEKLDKRIEKGTCTGYLVTVL